MPCYFPIQGYRSKFISKKGKRKLVFSNKDAFWPDLFYNQLTVSCGQCIGCRLERSRQWALRCMHESSLYQDNCFITLTYSNDYLPEDGSLNVRHFQLFMKRLRKKYGEGIRFFHCGEYGDKYKRPHYHAILFNHDFTDKVFWQDRNGQKLYRSKSLEELWPFGHSSVGSATFESAAYVARYIMKKVNGDAALSHYSDIDYDTGEVLSQVKPEYVTMSRRPGIGRAWYDKFKDDVYPRDEVVVRGKQMRPPKFYDSLYEIDDPLDFERVKFARKRSASKFKDNNTPDRLEVRRKVKESKIKTLVRNYEGDI
nr:MAG: replication initiator protein [Microviridae sp.]